MPLPETTKKFIELIKRYEPYFPYGRIFIPRSKCVREGLDFYEVDLSLKLLMTKGVIKEYQNPPADSVDEYCSFIPTKPFGKPSDETEPYYYHSFEVDQEKLDELLEEAENLNSKNQSIFLPEKSLLMIGDVVVQLPPFKNGYAFCNVMFKHPVGHLVDWSEVNEEIVGGEEVTNDGKAKKKIRDMIDAINKRVKQATDGKVGKLFSWEIKTIRRNY